MYQRLHDAPTMTVCKFYAQGNCRFGDQCKFEHPGAQSRGNQNRGYQQNQNQNRFSAFNNANTAGGNRGNGRTGGRVEYKYYLDPEIIKVDLSNDRPIWPFSSYGPGRLAPRQLIEGPILDQSPEEIRLQYYLAAASGNDQQAQAAEGQLLNQTNQQIQNILRDLNGACKYIQDGENVHPNREDICAQSAGVQGGYRQQQQQQPVQPQNALGSTGGSSFGQPSAFGAAAQPAQGSAFGQPNAMGSAAAGQQGAFGRPSAFGAPSALGGNTAFGKPAFGASTSFGQSASAAPAFGQPSQPGAFGQPAANAFGARPAGAFGQPSNPGATGAFGQPSSGGATGAFGQPTQTGFGQPAGSAFNAPQPGGFGQASNQQSGSGAFGQPAAPSAFGASATNAQPAQSNPFGAPAQPVSNAFGAPAAAPAANPFGQPANNGFGAPQTNGISAAGGGGGAGADYIQKLPNGSIARFKGKPVNYVDGNPTVRGDDGKTVRIFCPDGVPQENPYNQALPGTYGPVLEEAYKFLQQQGMFKDGIMPEEPPKHEWVAWDV